MQPLPLPYVNALYAGIFWLAYLIWFVLEFIGGINQTARHIRKYATVQDHGSQTLLVICLWTGIVLCFVLAWLVLGSHITWQPPLLLLIGVLLMFLGVALRWYAIWTLGHYFTRDVATSPNQRVIQTGPYRLIRHPAYSGTMLTLLGIGLAMTNWASLAAIVICTSIGYLYRVRVEEQALSRVLGQPYIDYMRRTRRFIPFIF